MHNLLSIFDLGILSIVFFYNTLLSQKNELESIYSINKLPKISYINLTLLESITN